MREDELTNDLLREVRHNEVRVDRRTQEDLVQAEVGLSAGVHPGEGS